MRILYPDLVFYSEDVVGAPFFYEKTDLMSSFMQAV